MYCHDDRKILPKTKPINLLQSERLGGGGGLRCWKKKIWHLLGAVAVLFSALNVLAVTLSSNCLSTFGGYNLNVRRSRFYGSDTAAPPINIVEQHLAMAGRLR